MICVYGINHAEQWDGIVKSYAQFDTYWLSGYVKAFQIHGDGEPLLISYESSSTRGINVVMKRDVSEDKRFIGKLPKGIFFDFVTPYGYGGWLIEGDDRENLFREYHNWLVKNKIISEFVRFHPIMQNQVGCEGFYEVVQLGNVVHMDLRSPEVIWENLTSKNRNVIRKAEKNDVKIYQGRSPEIYETFRSIYNGTMDKDKADTYYYFGKEFYDSILEDLPLNAQVFYAVKDGTVIATSIVLCANQRINYHLSGSLQEYGRLAPTNLLLYRAALWGHENGYKTLYLGGGVGSGEDGLFKFKRAFNRGKLHHFYIGKKIVDQEAYDELLRIRGQEIHSAFFPSYRAEA